MITIYDERATSFSGNGLGVLDPESCQVTHRLNGMYEVVLVHPIDDRGKHYKLQEGRILKVPVPAGRTPRMHIAATEQTETEIWRVYTGGDVRLNLRVKPAMEAKVIHAYRPGTEVAVVEKTNNDWWEVTTPDGKRGYMAVDYLRYVRTEVSGTAAEEAIIEPRALRDQPFRIYKIVPTLDNVTVYARHIYYDLMDNLVDAYEPKDTETGASVFRGVGERCKTQHDFAFYSDLDSTAEGAKLKTGNPAEIIQGDGGVIEQYGGELERDWFDVYLAKRIGVETGIHIRQGKNLLGIKYSVDLTKVATRIKPKGTDADGKELYLPEEYVDSPQITNYANPKWYVLDVKDAKEVTKGDDARTKEECYEIMRAAVQKAYDEGADLPDVTLNVDFVDVTDIEEYRQYEHLKSVHMGDTVRVYASRAGVEVAMRMTQYTYDCLMRQYTNMTLGTVDTTVEGNVISASQIQDGTLGGIKLVPGSVGTGQIADGAVNSLKIALASIGYAHIDTATIDKLAANSIEAIRADIHKLVAEEITTDELYADLAKIAVAQITAANIDKAEIRWAEIESLTTAIAEIATAQIGTASIDYAKIKDMVTDTAIFTEGVGGQLFVSRLAVTEANMVSLTVGELMLKAADGSFVKLVADGSGGVKTETVEVEGDNIAEATISGGKLIENTITARELNVSNIFADEALIKAIKAANIDVAELFAAQATIAALDSYMIKASTIEALKGQLSVWAEEKIALGVAGGVDTHTGIVINENGVYVEGKNIDLRTSDGDEYVHISESGVSASSISAPNVMARYDGPASIWVNPAYTSAELEAAPGARFRSLKDALAALSNKYVPYGVSVTMAAGAAEYGDAALSGCIAANDIGICGESASNRSKIYGKVTISRCAGEVSFGYLDVASSANTDGIYIDICSAAVSIFNCNFTGNGGGSAVSTNAAAHVLVSNVSMRHYSYAIYAYMTSTVYSSGNSGNCDIACDCSLVYGSGYQPSSTTTLSPAEIRGGMFHNGGCSVNQGSGGSSGAPTLTTKTYTATSTGSYKGSGSKYRNEVAQGWLSGTGRIRGCMWFDNASIRSAINGKTVMSASLRLSMRKGVGRGVAVTVELSGTYSNSGASSAAVTKSYGVLGTANPGETVTFTLPTAAVTDLVNGTINGLMLYSSDTAGYKEREYSKNYAVFDGASDSTPPVLTVIYQ